MDKHYIRLKPVTRKAKGKLALDNSARKDPLLALKLLAS
jgi:hypothetical protein